MGALFGGEGRRRFGNLHFCSHSKQRVAWDALELHPEPVGIRPRGHSAGASARQRGKKQTCPCYHEHERRTWGIVQRSRHTIEKSCCDQSCSAGMGSYIYLRISYPFTGLSLGTGPARGRRFDVNLAHVISPVWGLGADVVTARSAVRERGLKRSLEGLTLAGRCGCSVAGIWTRSTWSTFIFARNEGLRARWTTARTAGWTRRARG